MSAGHLLRGLVQQLREKAPRCHRLVSPGRLCRTFTGEHSRHNICRGQGVRLGCDGVTAEAPGRHRCSGAGAAPPGCPRSRPLCRVLPDDWGSRVSSAATPPAAGKPLPWPRRVSGWGTAAGILWHRQPSAKRPHVCEDDSNRSPWPPCASERPPPPPPSNPLR